MQFSTLALFAATAFADDESSLTATITSYVTQVVAQRTTSVPLAVTFANNVRNVTYTNGTSSSNSTAANTTSSTNSTSSSSSTASSSDSAAAANGAAHVAGMSFVLAGAALLL